MNIKDDIAVLDAKVSRLKVEYEQYFMRILKCEPSKLRAEVDRIIRVYSTKPISNTGHKFKYNALVAKYNSYKQYWNRVLRAMEEGTYVRRSEGAAGGSMEHKPLPTDLSEGAAPEAGAKAAKAEKTGDGCGGTPPGVDEDYIKTVCDRYIEARKECHEPTTGLSRETIEKTLVRNIEKVEKKYKTAEVNIKVYVKDGKAHLAITPKKKGAA